MGAGVESLRTPTQILADYWRERMQREQLAGTLSRDPDVPWCPPAPDDSEYEYLVGLVKGVPEYVLRMWRDLHWGSVGYTGGDEISEDGVVTFRRRSKGAQLQQVAASYGITQEALRVKIDKALTTVDDNQFRVLTR